MRQLRVVGVTSDGKHLRLAPSAKGEATHRVAIDDTLRAAIRGDLAPPGGPVESALSPREIQARLRAGESPEALAKAAGVPVTRIERYSGPVESERARVVEQARAVRMSRARSGLSAVPLGLAVDAALATTSGVQLETIDWTARRRLDGSWVVVLRWTARGRQLGAEWQWQPQTKALTPLGTMAARLGHVDAATLHEVRPAAKRTTAAKKAAAAQKATAKKATTKKATTKKATPAKKTAPAKKTMSAKRAAKKAATEKAVARKAAPRRTAPRSEESTASVPSWDQVLLSVTPRAKGRRSR